jgi:glucose/arabinose dehydrogenase
MKKQFLLILFLINTLAIGAQINDTIGNTIIKIDTLVSFPNSNGGLGTSYADNPWDLHWGPDDKLWYTMGSRLCRYDTVSHVVDTLFKRRNASGNYAMSVATHPNFAVTPIVYITFDTTNSYYSSGNRIVLYKYDYSISGDSLYNETEILSWYHTGEHSGGRLHIGIDNYLYVTTAEYWIAGDTTGNLSGKVLRLNLDGSIPAINSNGNAAISYGHRNPQGIVQLPNGNIIVSELGQIIDELNLINGFKYYGWPIFDGFGCTGVLPDSCISPTFLHEDPIDTAIRPPSGIAYYDHPAIPELQGCILQSILSLGGYQGGMVASKLNGAMDDIVSDVHYFKGEYLRWRDICVSPDGKIFAITNDRERPMIRVLYNPAYHTETENYDNITIRVYPNPTENFIKIETVMNIDEWTIISIDGKVHLNGTIVSSSAQLDISTLTPGIYFLKTKWGVKKFVKV